MDEIYSCCVGCDYGVLEHSFRNGFHMFCKAKKTVFMGTQHVFSEGVGYILEKMLHTGAVLAECHDMHQLNDLLDTRASFTAAINDEIVTAGRTEAGVSDPTRLPVENPLKVVYHELMIKFTY